MGGKLKNRTIDATTLPQRTSHIQVRHAVGDVTAAWDKKLT